MNINRNNYEEFFLLYADGELTSVEMQAVDAFTHQHPDLAEELRMLMEVVLPNEQATMPGKNRLLKLTEWNETAPTPTQTALLLHLDGELPNTQAAEIENELEQNAAMQQDWAMLQQTRLQAPGISMPDKNRLYRQTAIRRPISPVWSRIAAAAMLAGVGWFLITDGLEPETIIQQKTVTVQEPAKSTPTTPDLTVNDPITENQNQTAGINQTGTHPDSRTNINQAAAHSAQHSVNTPTAGLEKVVAESLAENGEKVTFTPANLVKTTDQTNITNTTPRLHTQNLVASTAVPQASQQNQETPDEYQFAREDEPEYLYIAGTKIKKQKVRGFMRTVGRTVTRGFTNGNIAQVEDQPIP